MNTPRKNLYYNSPYARPVKQYPSQSEDYISLDMGGSKQSTPMMSSNDKTPGRNNLKYYEQNMRNSNSKANKKNLFNNHYNQQNQRQGFNQQRFGQRRSGEWHQQQNSRNNNDKRPQYQQNFQHKKDAQSMSSYMHPSMTEDPWFELTQRLRALEKSQISTKAPSPASNASSNSNSDDDKDNESTSD